MSLAAVPCFGTRLFGGEAKKPDLPEGAVILVAQVKAKPGEEDTVKKAALAMVEPTHKEEGCIVYNLHQSNSDKSQFMFYEQWTSKQALDAHMQTPHMKTMQAAIEGRVEKVEVTFFTLVE